MSVPSLVFDIIALVLVVTSAAYYAKKGFIAGVLGLVGTVVSFFAAQFAAGRFAPIVFDQFFRPGLEEKAAAALADQSLQTLQDVLNSLVGFLPDFAIESMANSFQATTTANTADFASEIVTEMLAPLFIPIIALVLFLIIFSLLRFLLGMVVSIFTKANAIPLAGTANQALGAIMGVLVGAFYVLLMVIIMQGADALFNHSTINDSYFSDSIVYKLFSGIRFIAK